MIEPIWILQASLPAQASLWVVVWAAGAAVVADLVVQKSVPQQFVPPGTFPRVSMNGISPRPLVATHKFLDAQPRTEVVPDVVVTAEDKIQVIKVTEGDKEPAETTYFIKGQSQSDLRSVWCF